MTKTINTAIVGFGLSGKVFHYPFISELNQFNLKQIVTSKNKTELPPGDFEAVKDYQQVLDNPEIELVILCTPNQTHFSYTKRALEAGKHVILEKPISIYPHEAIELIKLRDQYQKVVACFHNRRYDADFLTIKKLIQNNTLGKIHTFESFFNRYRQPKAHWRESSQIGSGVLYDLGPHLIDQALELFGVPEKIFARLETQRKGAQNIDFFELHLIYLKNLTVRLQAGALFANYDQRFLIHGDLASVDKKFLDVQESQLKSGMKITDPNFGQDPENFKLTLADQTLKKIKSETGCYQQFYKEVFRAINGEKSHIPTLEQGLKTIQIIRLAMESTQDQKIIKVCL